MPIESGQNIPDPTLALPLLDANGQTHSLSAALGDGVVVLVFLRHFGCLACREHVERWKPRLPEFAELGARVVFIGNGQPDRLRNFVDDAGLAETPAAAYTDPDQELYRKLGLINSVGATFGPGAVLNALRAISKGNVQASLQGDPMQQGGTAIVTGGRRLVYLHREKRLGDYASIEAALERVRAR